MLSAESIGSLKSCSPNATLAESNPCAGRIGEIEPYAMGVDERKLLDVSLGSGPFGNKNITMMIATTATKTSARINFKLFSYRAYCLIALVGDMTNAVSREILSLQTDTR